MTKFVFLEIEFLSGLGVQKGVETNVLLINYYWFYKLMCKAVRIYNKTKVIEKTG
mgnify:CR=1 FL=1